MMILTNHVFFRLSVAAIALAVLAIASAEAAPPAPAAMIQVAEEAEIPAPARAVWETVGRYDEWDKFLSVVQSGPMSGQGRGAVRYLTITGVPDFVVERQDLNDGAHMTLRYTILTSPLPVDQYVSEMRVTSLSAERCRVRWSSRFIPRNAPPAEAEAFIRNFYLSGLADLEALFTPKLSVQQVIQAPPAQVWNVVGKFDGWGYFLDLESSRAIHTGADIFRVLTFNNGGGKVVERLDGSDAVRQVLSYSFVGAYFGIDHYTSTISVVPNPHGAGSLATWSGRFRATGDDAHDAASLALLTNLYTNGLAKLRARLESP